MHLHLPLAPKLLPSKPCLKWPGGKRRLLPQLLPLLPPGRRLIEPFVGAGSVFLATDYESYVINDANPDLMAMWAALQGRPREYVDDETPSFTQYTAARFGMAQQRELVDACWSAASRGVSVLVSNHDTATTRALYDGWEIHTVSVRRSVSADAESRVMTRELVARLG